MQLLANMFVVILSGLRTCFASETVVDVIVNAAYYPLLFGVSVIGTNLLAHRYLTERASTMIQMCVAAPLPPRMFVCFLLKRAPELTDLSRLLG